MTTVFRRKSIRLKGYDYREPGYYFVTMCVQDRQCLFGDIVNGEMRLNESGKIIETGWRQLSNRFPSIELDEFVVMPNHIHGIITILDVGAGFPRPLQTGMSGMTRPSGAVTAPEGLQPGTLGQIIAYSKYQSTKQINGLRNAPGSPVWQRGYYERVIRSKTELFQSRRYIQENPLKWSVDPENPQCLKNAGF